MASTTTNKTSIREGGNSSIQQQYHLPTSASPQLISCNSSSNSVSSSSCDDLPKSFIAAMRTLFNIMADERTGYVRFADIEQRWQEGSAGMPRGVIDNLSKY